MYLLHFVKALGDTKLECVPIRECFSEYMSSIYSVIGTFPLLPFSESYLLASLRVLLCIRALQQHLQFFASLLNLWQFLYAFNY
jgi:hypothetical protein